MFASSVGHRGCAAQCLCWQPLKPQDTSFVFLHPFPPLTLSSDFVTPPPPAANRQLCQVTVPRNLLLLLCLLLGELTFTSFRGTTEAPGKTPEALLVTGGPGTASHGPARPAPLCAPPIPTKAGLPIFGLVPGSVSGRDPSGWRPQTRIINKYTKHSNSYITLAEPSHGAEHGTALSKAALTPY